MPYLNEHSCRLNDPGKYDEFARVKRQSATHGDKEYAVIRGKLTGTDQWEDQAFRYDKDVWSEGEARDHCKEHQGTFEAAAPGASAAGDCLPCVEVFEPAPQMRLSRLLHYLASQVWAIEPRTLAIGQRLFRDAMTGRTFDGGELHAELGIPSPGTQPRADQKAPAKIAVIPILGVIVDHSASLGVSARALDAQFSRALSSKNVDAILFDIDSPGGVVTGIPELADKIAAARGTKPMLAYNGGMMASAAYWLGAATGEIVATQSALTGSIGVYTWHEDISGYLEKEGIKVTEFSAGEFKTESAAWKPLSEEAGAELQSIVDQAYGWFVKSVAQSRRDSQAAVREGYGRGRVLSADGAVKANLIDRVGTLEAALLRLAGKLDKGAGGRKAAALRRELELDALARKP